MVAPVIYPPNKQFLGLGLETTPGTPVVPTVFFPIDSFGPPEDKATWLDDKAYRGNMAALQGRVQGPIHSEFQISGPVFLDTFPYLVNNILGDQATTGTAPTVHAFSLLNSGTGQPSTLTFTHWQGLPATNQCRVYPGACLSELVISGNAESSLITFSAKGLAWPSSVAGAAVAPTFSAVAPQAAWRYLLGVGGPAAGGTQNKLVRDFQLTLTRALRLENTFQNSQSPFAIMRGALAVSSAFTATVPSDETFLNHLLQNTQPQYQILGTVGTGAAAYGLQIDLQNNASDTAVLKMDEEAVGYDITTVGVANATNAGTSGGTSPVKISVSNQTPASPY